jgi:divalent metal cation (Fe/Co/Zn/Cd) transporter
LRARGVYGVLVRKIAVRKILRAREAVRSAVIVSAVSLALSILGLLTYTLIVRSDVVLMEAFVWLIEALSFGGLAVAFKIAASRTVTYRARYEILRLESLAALIVSIVAIIITGSIAYNAMVSPHREPTPVIVSLYPLLSAVTSLALERWLHRVLHAFEVRLVSVRIIAEKLALDVAFEVGGGLAIIVANLTGRAAWEAIAVVIMAAYVIYGLYNIAKEAALHLIGVVPHHVHETVERKVRHVLRRVTRFNRVRRFKLESYGTFAEVEVWLEAPETMRLGEAYYESLRIARELVHEIPELLRALVILVPRRRISPLEAHVEMRLSSGVPRTTVRRRFNSRRLSSRLASQPSRDTLLSSRPRRELQQPRSQRQQSGASSQEGSSA